MSIDNIFKCCKKNAFLLVLSGASLGFSSSYALTDKFLNKPIFTAPIENSTEAPQTETPKISEPVKLGPNKNYLSLFLNSTLVVISGGLAYLSYGGGIIAISMTSYIFLLNIRGRMNMRFFRFPSIKNKLFNIFQDNNPGYDPKLVRDDIKKITVSNEEDMKKIIDQKVNESKQDYEKRIKKITDEHRDNIIRLNELYKMTAKENAEKTRKLIESMNKQIFFNIDQFEKNLIPRLRIIEEKVFNPSKTKTIFYNDSEGINETSMEDEEEIDLDNIKNEDDRQQVENLINNNQERDQVLFNRIANESLVYVQNKFYDIYMDNINKIKTERTFENDNNPVGADANALRDLYNRFKISPETSIGQLLPANLQLIEGQNNLSQRFYNTAYDDFKLFLSYGRKIILGEIKIIDNNGTIEETNMMVEFTDREKLKITYDTLPELVYTLHFGNNNFAHRLYQQYKFYIIPIFNRLRYLGISRFDPELSKLLKIVVQNKFPKHIKIITIPILENITKQTTNYFIDFNIEHGKNYFQYLFEDNDIFMLGSETIGEIKDFSEKYDAMATMQGYQGVQFLKIERYRKKAEKTLKRLISMMNKRDSYVDIIMIIEDIYSKFFPKEHAKTEIN